MGLPLLPDKTGGPNERLKGLEVSSLLVLPIGLTEMVAWSVLWSSNDLVAGLPCLAEDELPESGDPQVEKWYITDRMSST